MIDQWNDYMHRAYLNAQHSHDPSTQNGSVLVSHDGFAVNGVNNFPAHVLETDDRWERPKKYFFVEHAERSAIFTAARLGVPTNNATLIVPWAACADCARAIVVAGIKTLVRCPADPHAIWNESIAYGDEIMKEGGVDIVDFNYVHLGDPIELRRNEELMVIQ